MFQILVWEDDQDLNRTVCAFLNQAGYQATGCLDAPSAYEALYAQVFDLIVSDIMLPGDDGFSFVRNVRALNQNIPILFMTARDDMAAKQRGFRMGIDDYMVKPIDLDELYLRNVRALNQNIPILFMTARDDMAAKQRGFRMGIDDYMVKPIDLDELYLRIGALLRRARIAASRKLEVGSFAMDADEYAATLDGQEISLTKREFLILYKLLSYPRKTFTRQQLMDEFWDPDTETAPRAVDVYMTKLRSKLAECQDFEISYPRKTFTRQQLMDEFWDPDTETAPRAVDVYMTKLRSKLAECQDFEIRTVHGLGYKAVIL